MQPLQLFRKSTCSQLNYQIRLFGTTYTSPQPIPWNNHPNPNPFDISRRLSGFKKYVPTNDPRPYHKTIEYIKVDKNHLPHYLKKMNYEQKQQKSIDSFNNRYMSNSTYIEEDTKTKYISDDNKSELQSSLSDYNVNIQRRLSFGITDDSTAYHQIRLKLELLVRKAKSPEFIKEGLGGILKISRAFQRLLDWAELLIDTQYAFPIFDQIFFTAQKYGILNTRAYNQMIAQCERRSMNEKWYFV